MGRMGKKDFGRCHYSPACEKLYGGGAPTVRVSDFSDVYKAGCNFAIVIMYSYRGKFKWTANDGKIPTKYQNPEFRGRFLYVVFKNTSEWRPENFGTGGGQ